MTKQAVKQYVKEEYGTELTDEETEELFERLRDGALSDEQLEDVSGGAWQDHAAFPKVVEYMMELEKKRREGKI